MTFQATTLLRDCDAVLIPTAVPLHLPAGTQVMITQALGGNFTIQVNGNLARIEAQDADALGLEPVPHVSSAPPAQEATGPCDEQAVWAQLKTCYDPEIPVNIVDLGLIYRCECIPAEQGLGSKIMITMTLTAPGCGMGSFLVADIASKVKRVPNVIDVDVELVFDPPWDRERMSEVAQLELGLL